MKAAIGRLAAVAIAIAMVTLAIWFVRPGDDDGTSGSGGSGSGRGDGAFDLACAEDLAELCAAVEKELDPKRVTVVVETPSKTIERYASADPPHAWLTATPWPGLAEARLAEAGRSTVFDGADERLASRPVEVAVALGRWTDVVRGRCGAVPTWGCLVDAVDEGALTIGVASPETTDGVAAIGALVDGWFASLDPPLSNYDILDIDELFSTRLLALRDGAGRSRRSPLDSILTAGGSYGAVVVTGATMRLGALGRQGDLTVLTPTPAASVSVVLVASSAEARREVLKRISTEKISELARRQQWGNPDDDPTNDTANDGLTPAHILDPVITKWTRP